RPARGDRRRSGAADRRLGASPPDRGARRVGGSEDAGDPHRGAGPPVRGCAVARVAARQPRQPGLRTGLGPRPRHPAHPGPLNRRPGPDDQGRPGTVPKKEPPPGANGREPNQQHPTEGIPMIDEITTYTMLGHRGEHYEVPDAIQAAPGLVVFRLPHDLALNNPCRWNIGHHSGGCIAESMRRENALKGARIMASLHDWTQQPDTLVAEVDHRAMFNRLA